MQNLHQTNVTFLQGAGIDKVLWKKQHWTALEISICPQGLLLEPFPYMGMTEEFLIQDCQPRQESQSTQLFNP